MMVRGQKKVNIDIEEYKATQRQWQDKEKILEEHARLVEEHEREVSRLREERRAAGLIDDDDNNNRKKDMTNGNGNHNGRGNGDFEVIEEDADLLGQGGQEDMEVDTDAQPEGVQA
jgi:transcription factor TFIIIB component B''